MTVYDKVIHLTNEADKNGDMAMLAILTITQNAILTGDYNAISRAVIASIETAEREAANADRLPR